MAQYATVIGLIGVAIVLLGYGLFATHKLKGDDWRYPALNIVGTLCVMFSLRYEWNLPSFVAQVMWIILSVVGLLRRKKKPHA